MKSVVLGAIVLVALPTARLASAQGFLERLEQDVRAQLSRPADKPPHYPQTTPKPTAQTALPLPPVTGGSVGQQPGATGSEQPGYLGIVTDDREDRGKGVRIVEVRPGSPAEKAGLRPQDLITELGGIPIRQMSDLAAVLQNIPAGAALEFAVVRAQQRLRLEVTFGSRAPTAAEPAGKLDVSASAPSTEGGRIESLERRVRLLEQRLQQLEQMLFHKDRGQKQPGQK